MWQVAACVGIARHTGRAPAVAPSWSYRPAFSLPEEWYDEPGADALVADQWEGLGHIDPRARMYLQDLGLFADDAGDEIRRAFAPSAEARTAMERDATFRLVDSREVIGLHVRRGDTVTQPAGYQPLATIDFYAEALRRLPGELEVVIFSDDPLWCSRKLVRALRPHVGQQHFHVVNHGPGRSHRIAQYRRQPAADWLDLQLLALCSHLVISNSTYAWWAAWLSDRPVVLYPGVWWGPNLAHIDSSLMIPDGWEQVPC